MQRDQLLSFGPYRLDPEKGQLWRGKQEVKIVPKALAVLRALVTQPVQVVTKKELFQAVWPGTVVSDATLTSCIKELRQALRDDAGRPRYIETVHRRGYRFIGAVRSPESEVQSYKPELAPSTQHPAPTLAGREAELRQLHNWLEKALNGERQIVFVTGEPGIGKTALVEVFLQSLETRVQRLASEQAQGPKSKVRSRKERQGSTFKVQDAEPTPNPQPLTPSLWIGRGQCIEHYGAGEAYLPVLEALGRLCREPDGHRVIEGLNQHAPIWLAQMPSLLSAAELEALQRKTAGATRERMLRELAEAVEALTAERSLVLWLEDLHWSDVSTLDWLAFVVRRREQARLLVIGTYRPVEVLVREHPLRVLKQELQLHGRCQELLLDFLSEAAVREYLAVRFASPSPWKGEGRGEGLSRAPLQRLARAIYQRTDGNPLFMVNVVDYLVAQGVITQGDGQWGLQGEVVTIESGVPESLQQLIEQQLERLSHAERRVLEVASVAGVEFSAAAVAAGLDTEVEEIEERCEELARRAQFLRARGMGEWPDGTIAARYGFIHALYQSVLYERVPASRRTRLHQRIGEREEAAYGNQAKEIAAELAVHFERGRDYRRAVQYLHRAGENAIRRNASQEAIVHLTKGLELLKSLPDTLERTQQELTLQIALGPALGMTKGFAAPEVEKAYVRARELCQHVEATPRLFWILFGLCGFYLLRAELQTARGLAEQLLTLAQRLQEPALLVKVHSVLGMALFSLGELTPALEHLEQGVALYDPQQRHAYGAGPDPRVVCPAHAAFVLWLLGYPDQALQRTHEALTLAQELSHPFSLATALNMAAVLHWVRREVQAVQERAAAAMTLSTEQGFAVLLAQGTILRGWALAEQGQGEEGIAQIGQGLAAHRLTGTEAHRPSYLALLAEAHGKVGQVEEGLKVLAEALAAVDKTGERYYEAELYRLKGTLMLQQFNVQGSKFKVTNPQSLTPNLRAEAEAEACFLKAIEVARRQSAKSLELRTVMSLSWLWQQQGKKEEARQMLAEIYGWFTEGFETKDLQEAKALLQELI